MNIYAKLQKMRVALQRMNLKKSGKNTFAGYNYYELGDFLPAINQLMEENGVCSVITFDDSMAMLTLFNVDKPEETITFTSPMRETTLKGAHAIQNLGATETYSRRYLYMTAFEIVEADVLDATQGKEQPKGNNRQGQQQKPPKTQNKPPQQQGKRNANLLDTTRAQLNAEITRVMQLTGRDGKTITAELEKLLGFKMAQVTEESAAKVFSALEVLERQNQEGTT